VSRPPGFPPKIHGMSNTPTYWVWVGMRTRCLQPKHHTYPNYGGRGIKICERWTTFTNFLEDMGERPEGKSLDRINNDGDYEPSNCRWATPKEQSMNTRASFLITWNGETLCETDWNKRLGLSAYSVARRLQNGWSLERALTSPAMSRQQRGAVRHSSTRASSTRRATQPTSE
jgi:hypothetical protein